MKAGTIKGRTEGHQMIGEGWVVREKADGSVFMSDPVFVADPREQGGRFVVNVLGTDCGVRMREWRTVEWDCIRINRWF